MPVESDVILDGEVYCVDQDGQIDFELIQSRSQINGIDKIASTAKRLNLRYMVFDILHFNGKDLRGLPLLQRKEMLNEVLPDTTAIHKIQFLENEGIALFEAIKQQNLEGIVCKRKDSLYVGKRSSDWIKVINYQYVEVFISGYRKGKFGWIVSVMGTDGCLRTVGIIDEKGGVPPVHKQAFRGVCDQLVIREDRNFVYLEPRMRATVKFRNWTKNGMLRTPVFVDFVLHKAC
ncbi:ATP-dependent DNA ligase [Brevibacillus sp. 179-C9.3 HS]|uniref:ATP-dependent DNA ligase n=1 Tax=unclassified Brevibacillus TaxID=2684853 RepID=UPI0039A1156F